VVQNEVRQDGMLDNIAKEAFRRPGIEVALPFLPTELPLLAANSGLHDSEINRITGIDKSYPNLVRVPESNMLFQFVAFSKKMAFPTTDWSSLAKYRVGIIKGWKILKMRITDYKILLPPLATKEIFTYLHISRHQQGQV